MSEENKIIHIQKLSVHNFRALRELNYVPKQINILTGRNNTGKTALLDAIAFNIPGFIHEEIDNYDIEGPIDFVCCGEKSATISSNLNTVKIFSDASIFIKEHGEIFSDYFEKVFANINEVIVKDEIKKVLKNESFRKEYIGLIFENFDFVIFSSDFGYAICPYLRQRVSWGKQYDALSKKLDNKLRNLIKKYEHINLSQKSERLNKVFYRVALDPDIIFLREQPFEGIKNVVKISHFDKLSFHKISEEDLITLEEFIKNNNIVKNLRRLSQKDIVYQNADNSLITIPIDAHGDGFVSLLNTVRNILKAKNGILLIEEPENHLHPRYIDIFVENIFEYCKKLNVQVFMSTHSVDLIRSALKYPDNDDEKAMLLISKMTSDGQNIEKFDYSVDEGLKVIDELYQDLRGN